MNKVVLIGRFSKEHDVKTTQDGKFILKNSFAVNDGYGDKQKTHFFNIIAFGKSAETIANYTNKGSKILIVGSLQNNNYENKEGQKIFQDQIVINEFEFLETKKKEEKADDPFGIWS